MACPSLNGSREKPIDHLYPEVRAGGFTRIDGTIAFYTRVHALLDQLSAPTTVLDFGAGRGAAHVDDTVSFRRNLRSLRGKAACVWGVDVDDSVFGNPSLDKACVITKDEPLPFSDESIDLIISDFTFEHVDNPQWMSTELDRVLRRGGWLAARTPNRWGYIALASQLVPNRLKSKVLRFLQESRRPEDVFPTLYRCNTSAQLRRWFPEDCYQGVIFTADSEPAYFGNSIFLARLIRFSSWLTPVPFRSMIYVFLEKR